MNKIEYEQAFQESLDITFIIKRTTTDKGFNTEVSGFYYGKPNEENFELYKNKGVSIFTEF